MSYETIRVDSVVKETGEAFLFDIDGEETWVPKSVCEDANEISEGDVNLDVEIAVWFVRKEGLN